MFVVKRVTALAALLGAVLCVQAQAWQNLFPSFSGLTFGSDKFVSVSTDGLIKVLDKNAVQQSHHYAGNSLYSTAFGDGIFVVGSSVQSASLRSSNAANWTTIMNSSPNVRKLAFGAGSGHFVGVGGNNMVFVYDYEDEWWDANATSGNNLLGVAYGPITETANRFVVAGNAILRSTNMTANEWAPTNVSGVSLRIVTVGNGTYVAYGYTGTTAALYTSTDGGAWTQHPAPSIPAGMADMVYGSGRFVAVGAGGATAHSANGIDWTPVPSGSGDNFTAVSFGDGVFMALGANGSVYTSANGTSWEQKAEGNLISYTQVAFGGGRYVAVGDSGAVTSTDGRTWTRIPSNNLRRLTGIAYGNDRFVIVSSTGRAFIYRNTGGDTWTVETAANNSAELTNENLVGVAFGNNQFIVIASTIATAYTSSDGNNLSGIPMSGWDSGSPLPTSICFGHSRFWAGSTINGRLFSSSDGINWSQTAAANEALSGVRVASINYANGKLLGALATGSGGSSHILASDNGTAWSRFTAPQNVRSVTHTNGHYVAVGDGGRIFVSTNGQIWNSHGGVTNRNLRTIFGDATNVVAAGESGAILHTGANAVSIRHQISSRRQAQNSVRMSVDTHRSIPRLTLSFSADKNAKITFYSLNGRTLYTHHLKANEKSIELPKSVTQNGVIIAQYTGGGQKFAQRFQFTK